MRINIFNRYMDKDCTPLLVKKINYPNADVTQLTLVTKHGELELIDGDKEYIGSYKHYKTNAAGSIYEGTILIDDKSCSCLLAADQE